MKKRISLLLLVILFFVFSIGISYSYFVYRKSSDVSVINLSLPEKKTKTKKKTADIVTVNSYPMNATTARTKTDNYIDFEVETDSGDESMSYCIGIEYGNIVSGKDRFDLSQISFDLTNASSTYYLSDFSFDEIEHAECIRVVTLAPNSGTHKDNYRLRYWINESATVSDTDPDAKFKSTDDDLTDVRDLITDMFASFRVTITGSDRDDLSMSFTRLSTAKLHTTLGLTNSIITSVTYTNTNNNLVSNYESATSKSNTLATSGDPVIYAYANDDNEITLYSDAYIYAPNNFSSFFQGYSSLEYLGFENLFLTNVNNLSNTFNGCTSLTSLDLSDKKLPSLSNLQSTFLDCTNLDEILFGNYFNTLNVSIYTNMFKSCSSLTNLDLSFMDFRNATNLSSMFYGCSELASIDFGYADFRNVTNMQDTFVDSTNLENIYWNITNTSNLNNFNRTFCNCNSLVNLDVSNFTLNSCTSMSNTFKDCISLIEIDLSNVSKTGNIKMQTTFLGCDSLKVIKLPNMDFSRVTEMYGCFKDCINLERIDAQFNTSSSLTLTYEMFQNDAKIKYLDLNNMDVSSVINLYTMFSGCTQLETLLIDEWDVSSAASFKNLFNNCSSLINLDLSKWKNSISTSYYYMFYGCSSLKIVDLSGLDNSLVTNFTLMFCNCTNLKTIFVNENWVNPTNINSSVFGGNINLVGGSGTAFDSSKATSKYLVIDTPNTVGYLTLKSSNTRGDVVTGGSLLVNFNTLAGTTSNPNDYNILFNSITSIKFDNRKHNGFKIDVSYYGDGSVLMYVDGSAAYVSAPSKIVFPADSTSLFESFVNVEIINFNDWVDTSNVTQFANAFRNLSKLESLDFTGLDMSKVQSFERTFYNCTTITSIDLSNLNLSSLQSMFLAFGQDYEMTTCNFSGTTTTDNLTSLYSTFYRCRALTSLDLSGFDTSNVTAMRSLFNECQSLTTIDVSNFDTTQTDTMYRMFYKCSSLTTIYVSSSFVTTAVTSSGGMFTDSTLLVGGNGTVYDSSHVDVTYAVIDTASTPGYFTLKS